MPSAKKRKVQNKKYYQENKLRIMSKMKQEYSIESDKKKAASKARYTSDPDKKAARKARYSTDPDKEKAARKACYSIDPDKEKAARKARYSTDPGKEKSAFIANTYYISMACVYHYTQ